MLNVQSDFDQYINNHISQDEFKKDGSGVQSNNFDRGNIKFKDLKDESIAVLQPLISPTPEQKMYKRTSNYSIPIEM